MIAVRFDSDKLTGDQKAFWDDWCRRAQDETRALIKKWEQKRSLSDKDFDSKIWGELKRWLLEHVFHGKCAYCEVHIRESRQSGDAEHYRPKGMVNYRKPGAKRLTTVMATDPEGNVIKHPGYFWLAYNWRNLLPSCRRCNSEQGKKNQFPAGQEHVFLVELADEEAAQMDPPPISCSLKPDLYFLPPSELDTRESPLLLHPYRDDPREHLRFGTKGIEAAKELENGEVSEKAERSISVYDLGDDDLRRNREREQRRAMSKFFVAVASGVDDGLDPGDCRQRGELKLKEWIEGTAPFSAAVRDAYDDYCRAMSKDF